MGIKSAFTVVLWCHTISLFESGGKIAGLSVANDCCNLAYISVPLQ